MTETMKYVLVEKIWKTPHYPRPASYLMIVDEISASHVAMAHKGVGIARVARVEHEEALVRIKSVGYFEFPGYRCWGGCTALGLWSRGSLDTAVFNALESEQCEHFVNEDGDEVENGFV